MHEIRLYAAGCAFSLMFLAPTCASAQNLAPDPEFDDALTGWSLALPEFGGSLVLDTTVGSPSAPSAHLTAGGRPTTQAQSQCIAITDADRIDAHADIAVGAIPSGGSASLIIYASNDATCSGNGGTLQVEVGSSDCVPSPVAGWMRCSIVDQPLPPGTQSALLALSIGLVAEARFDHIGFGPTGTVPVTLQAFDVD